MNLGHTFYSRRERPRGGAAVAAWLTAAAVALCSTVSLAQSNSPDSKGSPSLPARAGAQQLPSVAYSRISAAIGKDDGSYHGVAHSRGVRMENAEHTLSADFKRAGVEFRLGSSRWGLALRGYGHGDAVQSLDSVAPVSTANRVIACRTTAGVAR